MKFYSKEIKDLADVVNVMTGGCWSPIVWTAGRRVRSAFRCAQYIALDFDDGQYTLKDAETFLKAAKLEGVIGTTKSHQKEKTTPAGKVTPAADRFRLLMKASHTIRSKDVYEANMEIIMEAFPTVDKSCKDAARFFYPCKEIVYLQAGKDYPVDVSEQMQAMIETKNLAVEEKSAAQTAKIRSGLMPGWMIQAIAGKFPEGGRHKMCYRIGATLGRAGWDLEQIVKIFYASPLIQIGRAELERAIENGYYAGRRQG